MGLYPAVPGLGGFLVGSPAFEKLTVHMRDRVLEISAENWSWEAPYVRGLRVNEEESDQVWTPWETIEEGDTIEFLMCEEPTPWGPGPDSLPVDIGTLPAK